MAKVPETLMAWSLFGLMSASLLGTTGCGLFDTEDDASNPIVENVTLPAPALDRKVEKPTIEATWPAPVAAVPSGKPTLDSTLPTPAKPDQAKPATLTATSVPPALGGICLVTMVKQEKYATGKETFATPLKGQKFLSSDETCQQEFAKAPLDYLPVTGAYCAYCWVDLRQKVPAQPRLFSVYKGKLYMFGAVAGKKAFDADPERYVKSLAEAE